MKRLAYYIGMVLLLVACQNHEEMEQNVSIGESSVVTVHMLPVKAAYEDVVSRGVDDVQTDSIEKLLYRLHYILVDSEGNFLEQKTLSEEDLATFKSLQVALKKGDYTLYLLGEGKNFGFPHVTEEVRTVTNVTAIWFHNIRFQPVRRELFYTAYDFTIDGTGADVDLDIELKRQIGMIDVNFQPSSLDGQTNYKLLGLTVMIPDRYLANYMTVNGELGFDVGETNGTGYYWTYDAPLDAKVGGYRFFMLPSLPDYAGDALPWLMLSYSVEKDGVAQVFNKEIPLKNLKVEDNRITSITIPMD